MLKKLPHTLILFALPALLSAQVQLSHANGTIAGQGHAKTHDFPVILKEFTISISAPDEAGYRDVVVNIPVKKITTKIGMRNMHMKSSMFKPKKFPEIIYRARTNSDLAPGSGILSGQLTIKDSTRDLDIAVTVSDSANGLHVTGRLVIVPTEFDLPLVGMGPMKVQDSVELDFDITVPGD